MAANHELAEMRRRIEHLQNQYNQAQATINQTTNALQQANRNNAELLRRLGEMNNQPSASAYPVIKFRKPEPFKGKGSILSWVVHMENYIRNTPSAQAMAIAISYLEGNAHEWWIVHSTTPEGSQIATWAALKEALLARFQPLNKAKVARDRLGKWKQVRDVSSFNEDFLRIILDIPTISEEEKVDRYTRGLKPYIWEKMCTKDYHELADAMADAERIEAATKRSQRNPRQRTPGPPTSDPASTGVTPMDIGTVRLSKLTPAEREQCRKEGRCFRCRQKGHSAQECPKSRRS